jgi:hypothetical protein
MKEKFRVCVTGSVEAFLENLSRVFWKAEIERYYVFKLSFISRSKLKTPTQYKRHRSITTVNSELTCLRRIFNIAIQEELDNEKSI